MTTIQDELHTLTMIIWIPCSTTMTRTASRFRITAVQQIAGTCFIRACCYLDHQEDEKVDEKFGVHNQSKSWKKYRGWGDRLTRSGSFYTFNHQHTCTIELNEHQ